MIIEEVTCFWCEHQFPLTEVERYNWDFPDKIDPKEKEEYRKLGWPDRTSMTTYCCETCHKAVFGKHISEKQIINNGFYRRPKPKNRNWRY